jgi:hypothetical protein
MNSHTPVTYGEGTWVLFEHLLKSFERKNDEDRNCLIENLEFVWKDDTKQLNLT